MKIRRTNKKNCKETTCGFTCISTEKVCRINSPLAKRQIISKTIELKKFVEPKKTESYYVNKQNNLLKQIKEGGKQYQKEALKTSIMLAKLKRDKQNAENK